MMRWPLRRPAVPPGTALYAAIVARARQPEWYLRGDVPDTVDGRFDVVALVLALVMLRLEGDPAAPLPVALTERFIADMDGSLRQLGFGDPALGKQVGHMVAALGGRLGAYRDALAVRDDVALGEALRRNVYRGAPVSGDALAWTVGTARALAAELAALPAAALAAERWGDAR